MVKNRDKRKDFKKALIGFSGCYAILWLSFLFFLIGVKETEPTTPTKAVTTALSPLVCLLGTILPMILLFMSAAIMKLQEEVEILKEQLGSSDSSES